MGTLAKLHTNYAKTHTMKIFLHSQGKLGLCLSDLFLNMFLLVFNLNLLLFQFNPIYPGSVPSGHTD